MWVKGLNEQNCLHRVAETWSKGGRKKLCHLHFASGQAEQLVWGYTSQYCWWELRIEFLSPALIGRITLLDRYVMVQNAAVNDIWFPTGFFLVWWEKLKVMNCICLGEETQLNFSGSFFVCRCSLAILHLSSRTQLTSLLTSVSWSQMTPGWTWQRQQPREWTASNLSTLLTTSSRWAQPGLPICHTAPAPCRRWLLYQSWASFARNCCHKMPVLRALICGLKFML